jgi:hypothetical protein
VSSAEQKRHDTDPRVPRNPSSRLTSEFAHPTGDFDALLALLDPDVVVRADGAAVDAGAPREVRGAPAVAGTFSGRATQARTALLGAAIGAAWAPGGRPRIVFGFTITDGKIVAIDILADPERLRELDVAVLDQGGADPG